MTVWACIGGGSSLTVQDIDFCRDQGWKLATCNMGYQLCPDASIFYAMDKSWWANHGHDALKKLVRNCIVWTGKKEWAEQWGLNLLTWNHDQPESSYSPYPGHANGNRLSGIQLINIVAWQRPSLIVLLGYDNQGPHWHPEYTEDGTHTGILPKESTDYATMAATCPIPIINASRQTSIEGIPRATLEEIANAR